MNTNLNDENIQFVCSNSLDYIEPNIADNSVQIVYLDPPFFKQMDLKQYNKKDDVVHSFSDKWESLEEYLHFIEVILKKCKDKLLDSGLIFLHCDTSANHNLRIQLDNVFGRDRFVNEIIWSYKRWSNSSSRLLEAHQTIWVYSKSNKYQFNRIMTNYSPTTNVDQILQMRERNSNGVVVYKRDNDDEIISAESKNGVPLRDVWEIPFLNPKAKERVGYPTQKPIELMNRILQISCREGDLVLDPFCGSGSMGISAKINKCKYIGIDQSDEAIAICRKRQNEYSVSISAVKDGNYESFNNLDKEIRDFLNEIGAIPIERNKGLDGIYSSNDGMIGIRFQRDGEALSETISVIKKASFEKPISKRIVVKTHDGDLFDVNSSDVLIIESLFYRFNKAIAVKTPSPSLAQA